MNRSLIITASLVVLASCALYPDADVVPPAGSLTSIVSDELEHQQRMQAFAPLPGREWWLEFEDPGLNFLIEQVLDKSFDVRRAVLNVDTAEASLRVLNADLYPMTSVVTSLGLNEETDLSIDPSFTSSLGFNTVWSPDLFGQVRETIKAGEAALEANEALQRDAVRLVLSQTAQIYANLRITQSRVSITEQNLARLDENIGRIRRLVEAGFSTRLDLSRAEQQFHGVETELALLQIAEKELENALSLLTLVSPATIQSVSQGMAEPAVPELLPLFDIEYIVKNRPDLRAAEFNLMQAFYNENVARGDLYPSVNLNFTVAGTGSELRGLPSLEGVSLALANSVATPLLGRGRILGQIEIAEINTASVRLNYEEAVITAVLDIDQSVANWERLNEQVVARKASLDAAIDAQSSAEILFFAGEVEFTTVLIAEQARLDAEQDFLVAKQGRILSYIDYVSAVVPQW